MKVPGGQDSYVLEQCEKDYLHAVAEDPAWYRFWR
jgi:hypothetical protein